MLAIALLCLALCACGGAVDAPSSTDADPVESTAVDAGCPAACGFYLRQCEDTQAAAMCACANACADAH